MTPIDRSIWLACVGAFMAGFGIAMLVMPFWQSCATPNAESTPQIRPSETNRKGLHVGDVVTLKLPDRDLEITLGHATIGTLIEFSELVNYAPRRR